MKLAWAFIIVFSLVTVLQGLSSLESLFLSPASSGASFRICSRSVNNPIALEHVAAFRGSSRNIR